jgi:hypothetical protein
MTCPHPELLLNMRFHHVVLLAALAIAPVSAERIKVSDERGIVNSMLSGVGGVDCGGGGGLGCDQIIRRRMVGGVAAVAGRRAEKKDAVIVGGRGAAAADELRCNDVGQRIQSRGISGSRRGKQDVSSPTANPKTTIPGGEIVARRGQSTLSTAVTGGNRRHDEDDDDDDAQTNVAVVPYGGGVVDGGDRALSNRRLRHDDNGRTRQQRR